MVPMVKVRAEKTSANARVASAAVKEPAVCYPRGGHCRRRGEEPGGPGLEHRCELEFAGVAAAVESETALASFETFLKKKKKKAEAEARHKTRRERVF